MYLLGTSNTLLQFDRVGDEIGRMPTGVLSHVCDVSVGWGCLNFYVCDVCAFPLLRRTCTPGFDLLWGIELACVGTRSRVLELIWGTELHAILCTANLTTLGLGGNTGKMRSAGIAPAVN